MFETDFNYQKQGTVSWTPFQICLSGRSAHLKAIDIIHARSRETLIYTSTMEGIPELINPMVKRKDDILS